jgi:hypothetical protein
MKCVFTACTGQDPGFAAALREGHAQSLEEFGFWTTLIGDSNHELTYLLAWESLAEREKKWTEFMSDPRWISARAESERDGPIIQNARNQILQPTAFSAVR